MVKWAFGLSNGSFGLVRGSAASWCRTIFITWTGWTLAVVLSYDDSTINIVVIIIIIIITMRFWLTVEQSKNLVYHAVKNSVAALQFNSPWHNPLAASQGVPPPSPARCTDTRHCWRRSDLTCCMNRPRPNCRRESLVDSRLCSVPTSRRLWLSSYDVVSPIDRSSSLLALWHPLLPYGYRQL